MIQPPNWKNDAIPARNGWKDPKTGEILKSQSITQAQIDEYMGVKPEPKKEPILQTHDIVENITKDFEEGNNDLTKLLCKNIINTLEKKDRSIGIVFSSTIQNESSQHLYYKQTKRQAELQLEEVKN